MLTSLYGIVSFLPIECIFAMATGQGVAGILMNITRYITLICFSSNSTSTEEEIKMNKFKESLVFFSFSGFICFLCVLCIIYLYNNSYFQRRYQAFMSENEEKDLEKMKINDHLLENDQENVFNFL